MSRMRALAELIQRNRATDPPRAIDEEARLPSDGYMVSRIRWQERVLAGGLAESVDHLPAGTRLAEIIEEIVWALQVINRTTGLAGHKKLKGFWPDEFGSGGALYADEKRGKRILVRPGVDEVGEAEAILDWPTHVQDEQRRRALMLWCGAKATGRKPSRIAHRLSVSLTTFIELRDVAAAEIAMRIDGGRS